MIECVPNLSEGRDRGFLEDVAEAVRQEGCRVVDVHCDADHHRSVFTIVADPERIIAGILTMVEAVIPRIDVRKHRGEHPRIGAVDVVPFVPISNSSLDECVRLAKATGEEIGRRFDVPVYLYEAAASSEDRRNLARIRQGGLSGVAKRIGTPTWRPDFGPAKVHPTAGAIAVGARRFLVAYNVNLASDDLGAARAIAFALRASNGGPPGVKALGLRLGGRGIVQVSMNLTDVQGTTLSEVFERVSDEADRLGLRILESEIVGLVPRVVLGAATTESLRLTRDLDGVVLEHRLAEE